MLLGQKRMEDNSQVSFKNFINPLMAQHIDSKAEMNVKSNVEQNDTVELSDRLASIVIAGRAKGMNKRMRNNTQSVHSETEGTSATSQTKINKGSVASSINFQNPGLSASDLQDLDLLAQEFKAHHVSLQGADEISVYSDLKWAKLGVKPEIVKVLEQMGFHYPSPVQALSIPRALEGKDLLVRAKNGTGKSAAFIIPAISRIDTSKALQVVILVPIRELALQISKFFMAFAKSFGIITVPLIGGTSVTEDVMRLSAGVHVVIGTPGRIVALLGKGLCKIEDDLLMVFDEADKLLDSHFYKSIHDLLTMLPKKRQLLLYSATFPHSVEGFVHQHMHSPLKIKVSEQNLQNIKQYYAKIRENTRLACLRSLLSIMEFSQCIIYCNDMATAKVLAQNVTKLGISAYFIYSEMKQEERNIVYQNFSNKNCRILVSTDITTRGIDAPGVDLVINYHLPYSSESYLHRIGRAGRFGTKGCAINFIANKERPLIQQYKSVLNLNIMPISDESFRSFCKK